MTKEPKTCWTCKFRQLYKNGFYCEKNPITVVSWDKTYTIQRRRDVGGRHTKCEKYEHK